MPFSATHRRSKRAGWLLIPVVAVAGFLFLLMAWRQARERSQDDVILAAAYQHNIHPALIKAVVWRESWFDPNARGTSGEMGLMQIREPTARDWATAEKIRLFTPLQLFDPARNTQCGAWYLRRLLNRYRATDNPLPYALAAYNAGPTHVARWSKGAGASNSTEMLRQMDFPSTRKYVAAISGRYVRYRESFPPKNWHPKPLLTLTSTNSINHESAPSAAVPLPAAAAPAPSRMSPAELPPDHRK